MLNSTHVFTDEIAAKDDMIKWLKERQIDFSDVTAEREIPTVFVYSHKEHIKKKFYPRKYKDLYVPYLRLSWNWEDWEDDGTIYVRDNGYCYTCTNVDALKKEILDHYR